MIEGYYEIITGNDERNVSGPDGFTVGIFYGYLRDEEENDWYWPDISLAYQLGGNGLFFSQMIVNCPFETSSCACAILEGIYENEDNADNFNNVLKILEAMQLRDMQEK